MDTEQHSDLDREEAAVAENAFQVALAAGFPQAQAQQIADLATEDQSELVTLAVYDEDGDPIEDQTVVDACVQMIGGWIVAKWGDSPLDDTRGDPGWWVLVGETALTDPQGWQDGLEKSGYTAILDSEVRDRLSQT